MTPFPTMGNPFPSPATTQGMNTGGMTGSPPTVPGGFQPGSNPALSQFGGLRSQPPGLGTPGAQFNPFAGPIPQFGQQGSFGAPAGNFQGTGQPITGSPFNPPFGGFGSFSPPRTATLSNPGPAFSPFANNPFL